MGRDGIYTSLPAIAEWRFVKCHQGLRTGYCTRYRQPSVGHMLEHIRHTVHDTIRRSDAFAHYLVYPDAACLVKEAQILACTHSKVDSLLPHLQYLDQMPEAPLSLAVFAVELFRRLQPYIYFHMSADAEQHYRHMCFVLNDSMRGFNACDPRGENRRGPPA
jgi:hypothetical protein